MLLTNTKVAVLDVPEEFALKIFSSYLLNSNMLKNTLVYEEYAK